MAWVPVQNKARPVKKKRFTGQTPVVAKALPKNHFQKYGGSRGVVWPPTGAELFAYHTARRYFRSESRGIDYDSYIRENEGEIIRRRFVRVEESPTI